MGRCWMTSHSEVENATRRAVLWPRCGHLDEGADAGFDVTRHYIVLEVLGDTLRNRPVLSERPSMAGRTAR